MPALFHLSSPDVWNPDRDAMRTMMKERFMYGKPTQKKEAGSTSKMDQAINAWIKSLFIKEKKNGEDFIDDQELTLVKGGIANHFKKRVKLQDSVESLSDTEFQTMYPRLGS